ncbi:aminotransferase class I/II-fold pyridoxal phosphate-dependent enzyme [Oceanithermus sp.]|uniref:aminotransferase class I/II-fold pyridoxal phosphate-dependent enzyme n=1 Tax=Oceanithermus sp. TaxID=2268145 RepID=UPI0025D9F8A0|nr:aminotransferase class I/II-fold pyridoxal phosphate-dependent enzyme [Oceanithermus sp.]
MTPPNRWASERVRAMPESVFLLMDRAKSEARAAGKRVIDLSIGASDLPVPNELIAELESAARDPATWGYCLKSCTLRFLEEATRWYERRFGLALDPGSQALSLIGSQEGLAHLLLAVADPGDVVLIPEVAYPSYWGAAALAGLEAVPLELGDDLLPVFEGIEPAKLERARVLVLNYPNNPTAALADRAFWERALAFAEAHDLLVVHDNPYIDMVYEGEAVSPLVLPGALERTVELFSFSKSFHMGGFRLGFALGNADAIAALEAAKAPVDFNQYLGIQRMGIAALRLPADRVLRDVQVFRGRRDALVEAMQGCGVPVNLPKASMYLWLKLPEGMDDVAFALRAVEHAGVALAPGRGFGPGGHGYVRFALVQPPEVLAEAGRRIAQLLD